MTSFVGPDDARLRSSGDPADLARMLGARNLGGDAAQDEVRRRMLAFIDGHPDALWRSCTDGHFTGSAIVVDAPARRALLLFHTKHQRWLQPGGHADGDANLAAVALREATEETGIGGLRIDPEPVDLDIHAIPARPGEGPHLHLDARYLVVAPAGAEPAGNHESEDLGWFAPDALGGLGLDDGTRRLVVRGLSQARARLGAGRQAR
jgi:8-oxo-dGTP pyrophosphatase MutT (NUDIX family)